MSVNGNYHDDIIYEIINDLGEDNMRALFYLEDKLVAEEFYKCQEWKGENGNYLVIDTERGQRLFLILAKIQTRI